MAEEGFEIPPERDGRLPLRKRTHIRGATTGHAAVRVVAGAGDLAALATRMGSPSFRWLAIAVSSARRGPGRDR
jgi:hypothetical protein